MSTWAITGGSGFLGHHLARELVGAGHAVRTLDVESLDAEPEPGVEALVGDVRDPERASRLCEGVEVLVHAAAALPIRRSKEEIWSINVEGTEVVLDAAVAHGVRRVVYVSTTAVYGVPETSPITEDTPIDPLGAYGVSKAAAEEACFSAVARGIEVVVLRPKTFLGPGRLGIFQILFQWIREGRRIYLIGSGHNRYQLLAVDDLVAAISLAGTRDASGGIFNLGAKGFGTVRADLHALVDHARSPSRLVGLPARPAQTVLRALELARLSPLAEWHYKTAGKDSYVDVTRAEQALGWTPRRSNVDTLIAAYDWFLANEAEGGDVGTTHRTAWSQRALALLRRLS